MVRLLLHSILFALATAQTLPFQQRLINDDDNYLVPGSNPFTYCTDPEPYILQISSLNFTLSKPKNNTRNLTISLDSHLTQAISKGSGVLIQTAMKIDGKLIPFEDEKLDLCDELEQDFDLKCPVKSGVETRERNLTLFGGVEGVEYVVVIDAWTKEGDRLTCLMGEVQF